MKGGTREREEILLTRAWLVRTWFGRVLGSTRFASRTPSVFLSFFLYSTLSFPLYFPGKTPWKSSNFGWALSRV